MTDEVDVSNPFAPEHVSEPVVSDCELEVVYPDFNTKSRSDRFTLLVDALVDNPNNTLSNVLGRYGISRNQFLELSRDEAFVPSIRRLAKQRILGPEIPNVYKSILDGAREGNDAKQKLFLQSVDGLQPENQTNILNLSSESPSGLLSLVEDLKLQIKGLQEDDIVDIEARRVSDDERED